MKPAPAVRIPIAAALCVAALCALVARESIERARGTEVLLAMEAVDPRSVLSGHYVIVSLQETIPPGFPCPAGLSGPNAGSFGSVRSDAPTWVALAPAGDHHRAVAVAATRARARSQGPLVARGDAFCQPSQPGDGQAAGMIGLDLGIDRFHIDQTQAERIEKLMRARAGEDSPVSAIVSIGRDGRARLKGLVVEGERMELKLL
jgi:uncharacterized membrane-anchored protein